MSIRKEKIRFFEQRLADFFQKAGRETLPWRKKRISAYEVWVSEIMLQQTQVVRVVTYYEKFLHRFPTVGDLARASWVEFLPFYQGLGYYVRGRNMLRAAQRVVEEYGGQFPRDKKLLESLPGVGPYTAAAIMSFAYGDNHLAWDTNLFRVIGRFFFGGKHLVSDEVYWEDAFVTSKKELNATLMDFGSALCSARPKCSACSLRSRCIYFQEQGKQEEKIRQLAKDEMTHPFGEKKKVDWRGAQVYLFLHENHRHYYSATKKVFQPFVLSVSYNTRAGIKKYFADRYHLTLSVRPPHHKLLIDGQPTLLVNAQILLGTVPFSVFSKKAWEEYNEGIPKKLLH